MKEEGIYLRGYEHLTPNERTRARRADKIYGAVAREVGVEMDAFYSLCGWLEYLETDMEDAQLWETARVELTDVASGKMIPGQGECSFSLH